MMGKEIIPKCRNCENAYLVTIAFNVKCYCGAIGYAYAQDVYNSEQCKKAYSKAEPKKVKP